MSFRRKTWTTAESVARRAHYLLTPPCDVGSRPLRRLKDKAIQSLRFGVEAARIPMGNFSFGRHLASRGQGQALRRLASGA